jgi:signal transduction histidine kinase
LLQHSISCRTPDTAVMIDGDEVRLEQVIQNLLQNAVRYSPNGGKIEVVVAADEQEGLASLHVCDQGIGIASEAMAQLFERFYRVPDSTIEHIHGVGIGLYVVKEIVTLHGGAVEVASEAGVGSTFTVNLPLRAGYSITHGERAV